MPALKTHTLSDGRQVTSSQVAQLAGISTHAANWRLHRSKDPDFVLAPPGEVFDAAAGAKVFVLDDGQSGTVRQLAEKAGLRINTMRQRLKNSLDPAYVMRPEVFDCLHGKIYTLPDGTETTVKQMAIDRQCSDTAAYDFLEALNLPTRRYLKEYVLDTGIKVTVDDVIQRTGLSRSAAKKRLAKSRKAADVLKPHHIRDKRVRKVTRLVPGEHGVEKQISYEKGAL